MIICHFCSLMLSDATLALVFCNRKTKKKNLPYEEGKGKEGKGRERKEKGRREEGEKKEKEEGTEEGGEEERESGRERDFFSCGSC